MSKTFVWIPTLKHHLNVLDLSNCNIFNCLLALFCSIYTCAQPLQFWLVVGVAADTLGPFDLIWIWQCLINSKHDMNWQHLSQNGLSFFLFQLIKYIVHNGLLLCKKIVGCQCKMHCLCVHSFNIRDKRRRKENCGWHKLISNNSNKRILHVKKCS